MKKVLLFGMAILVATSVLAFGGGGGKSRKSSVYRGVGVDSIGVHFSGKDSDSEETCSDGVKCGKGCCYGDNVCSQNESGEYQCCNEELNFCCPAGESASRQVGSWASMCCTGTLFCFTRDADGNCVYNWSLCCPSGGKPYLSGRFSYGDNYTCCNGEVFEGKGLDGSDLCCTTPGTEPVCYKYDENNVCIGYICCPKDTTPYCLSRHGPECDGGSWSWGCCAGEVTPGGSWSPDTCNQ